VGYLALTISRELASGGEPLARRAAERLGFVYLDRAILQRAARELGLEPRLLRRRDECPSGFWDGVLKSFALSDPLAVVSFQELAPYVSDRDLFAAEARVIAEVAARRDVVVVGRAGFWVLRDHPGLASVFLHAPRQTRAETLRGRLHLDDSGRALARIEQCDEERGRWVKAMTGQDWRDTRHYHLSLDAQRLGLPAALEMTLELVERTRAALCAPA
jgi:cytidylate kinase